MKIAIHQPRISYYNGGGERVPLEHAKYLSRLGHEVTIVTTKPDKESEMFSDFREKNPRVRIAMFDLPKEYPEIYAVEPGQNQERWDDESLAFGRMTAKYYAENIFDLVAVHYTVDALLVPKNQKAVLHLHGCPAQQRSIDAESLDRADSLVGVSLSINQYWKKMYGIKEEIVLSYNGMDIGAFYPLDIREEYDLFFLGRLIKIKGVEDLIRAVALVVPDRPDISAVIAGNGPERKSLEQLAAELGLAGNISFAGRVFEKDLLSLYNKARICAFPSTAKEGVLTTMLEAAACAKSVITANCCGMVEFIDSGRNGLLVEPGNPEEMAAAIRTLLGDAKLRSRLGGNARSDIARDWTWEKRIMELENIYKQCLKAK